MAEPTYTDASDAWVKAKEDEKKRAIPANPVFTPVVNGLPTTPAVPGAVNAPTPAGPVYIDSGEDYQRVKQREQDELILTLSPYAKATQEILKNSSQPIEDMDKMVSSAFLAQRMGVSVTDVFANHDVYAEAYWGRVTPVKTAGKAIADSWNASTVDQKIAMLRWKQMTGNDSPALQQEIDLLRKTRPDPDSEKRAWPVELLKSAANMAPYQWENFKFSLPIAGGMGAMGALPGLAAGPGAEVAVPALFARWFMRGLTLGSTIYTFEAEAGLQYDSLVEEGVPKEIALLASLPVGAVNAALEQFQLKNIPGASALLNTIKGKIIGDVVKDTVASGAMSKLAKLIMGKSDSAAAKYLANAVKEYAVKGLIVEPSTEVLQEITGIVSDSVAKSVTNRILEESGKGDQKINQQTAEQIKDRLLSTYVETAKSMIVMGLGGLVGGGAKATGAVAGKARFDAAVSKAEASLTGAITAPPAEMYKNPDGSLYTVKVERNQGPDGARVRYVAGDPTKATDNSYAKAEVTEGVDTVTIEHVTAKEGFEGTIPEMVSQIAREHAGKEIVWNPTDEAQVAMRDALIAQNPRGADFGLQKFEAPSVTLRATVEKVKQAFSLDDSSATRFGNVVEALAKNIGETADEFLSKRLTSEVVRTGQGAEDFLAQQGEAADKGVPRGAVTFYAEGGQRVSAQQASSEEFAGKVKGLIHAFEGGDLSTALHEFFHVVERYGLSAQQQAVFERALGKARADWTTDDLETLAYGFEEYHRTGKAPTAEMRSVFRDLAAMLAKVLDGVRSAINLPPTLRTAYHSMYARLEHGDKLASSLDMQNADVASRQIAEAAEAGSLGVIDDTADTVVLKQVAPPVTGRELRDFVEGLSPEARKTYDLLSSVAKLGKPAGSKVNFFAKRYTPALWNSMVRMDPSIIIENKVVGRTFRHEMEDYLALPKVEKKVGGKSRSVAQWNADAEKRIVAEFRSYLENGNADARMLPVFEKAKAAFEQVGAAARDAVKRIPSDLRKGMMLNEDGTVAETGAETEFEFKYERAFMQRLIDALPIETMSSTYEVAGKAVKLNDSDTITTVGGEAYRRAILAYYREQFKNGTLPPLNIGTGAVNEDAWGAIGFLGANSKTIYSGDFTTLCPQIMFNGGCWYCYRRAALESGANNKLAAEKVWYTGELLRLTKAEVNQLNATGGLRVQSFGDWMDHFTAQFADMLADADSIGLQVKVITKEADMVEVAARFKEQGVGDRLYFNISTDYNFEQAGNAKTLPADVQALNPKRPFLRTEDGKAWWKRALTVDEGYALRVKYPWVNVRVVATTLDEFIRALEDDRIDTITGYHGKITQHARLYLPNAKLEKDVSTGATRVVERGEAYQVDEVEAIGDNGMPWFREDGTVDPDHPGELDVHKRMAEEISKRGLQKEYWRKVCCITGKCATCRGICGLENRAKDSFWYSNEKNRDLQQLVVVSKERVEQEETLLQTDALHGTGYLFKKFDTAKMGSGEGAQVFGWGLYFTSRDDIARHYAELVARKNPVIRGFEIAGEKIPNDIAVGYWSGMLVRLSKAQSNTEYVGLRDQMRDLVAEMDQKIEKGLADPTRAPATTAAQGHTLLELLDKGGDVKATGGRVVYSVSMLRDNFMEWYSPLSKQHLTAVQNQLLAETIMSGNEKYEGKKVYLLRLEQSLKESDGSHVYRLLTHILGSDRAASEFLLRCNIDGIRFPVGTLTGNNQQKSYEKGTNYVIFDATNVQINSAALFQRHPEFDNKKFWEWFGDSKVVDEKGMPMRLYHGTSRTFDAFSLPPGGKGEQGIFFTDYPDIADSYLDDMNESGMPAGSVYPVYLSLQNPMVVDWTDYADSGQEGGAELGIFEKYDSQTMINLINEARYMGHDGLIINNIEDMGGPQTQYVAFDPAQIKSPYNRGDFSRMDNRILFQRDKALEKTFNELALKAFKTTDDPTVGCWILSTGEMLDFSPKAGEDVYRGRRYHVAISKALDKIKRASLSEEMKPKWDGASTYLKAWMAGAIRMELHEGTLIFQSTKTPTAAQMKTMKAAVGSAERVRPEIVTEDMNERTVGSIEFGPNRDKVEAFYDAPDLYAPGLYQNTFGLEQEAYDRMVELAKGYKDPTSFRADFEKKYHDPEQSAPKGQEDEFYNTVWNDAHLTADQAEILHALSYAADDGEEEAEYNYNDKLGIAEEITDPGVALEVERGTASQKLLREFAEKKQDEVYTLEAELADAKSTLEAMFAQLSPDERDAYYAAEEMEQARTDFEAQQKRIDTIVNRGEAVSQGLRDQRDALNRRILSLEKRLQTSSKRITDMRARIDRIRADIKSKKKEQRAAEKNEALRKRLIKDIMRSPSRGVSFKGYAETILSLQSHLDPKRHTSKKGKPLAGEKVRAATREFLDRNPEAAEQMPAEVLDRIFSVSLGDMTIGQLEEIDATIDHLRKLGQKKRSLQLSQERRLRDAAIAQLQAAVMRGDPAKPIVGAAKPTNWWDKIRLATLKPDRIALLLDGGKEGPFTRWLQDEVEAAWGRTQKAMRERMHGIVTVKMEELKLTMNPLAKVKGYTYLGDEMDIGGFRMSNGKGPTVQDAMYWYIGMRNERTRAALLNGNKLPENVIMQGIAMLTPQQKELADAVADDFDQNFARLREAFIDAYNVDLPQESFYVPMRRMEFNYDSRAEEIADDLTARAGVRKAFINRNPTFSRIDVPAEFQKPIRTDLMSLWSEGVRTQETFIAEDLLVKRLHYMMESGPVTSAIQQRYGGDAVQWVKTFIDNIARPDIYAAHTGFEKISRTMRGNAAIAWLGFNVLSASKQLVSVFGYLADAGPLHIASAAAQFAAGQGKSVAKGKLLGNTLVEWVEERSELVRNRSISQELEELKRLNKGVYENIVRSIGGVSMKMLEVVDKTSIVIGWKAVYDKNVKRVGEVEAAKLADKATVRSQPSGRVHNLAAIYRSGDVAKWFTMFTADLNAIWNRIAFDIPNAVKNGHVMYALSDAIAISLAGMGIAVATGALRPDADDKDRRRLFYGIFAQYVESVPLVGAYLMSMLTGQQSASTGVKLFPAIDSATAAVREFKDGDYEQMLSKAAESLGMLVGVPITGPKRAIEAVRTGRPEALLGWKERK